MLVSEKLVLTDRIPWTGNSFNMTEQETYTPGERGQRGVDKGEPKPLFELGQVVGTPGALLALEDAEQHPVELLTRHVTGDWGCLPEEDKEENELSVAKGFRIFSAYGLHTGVNVWLITEWDRSVTTILLPEEY